MVRTGSKVSVVGWLEVVARWMARFRTGTSRWPSHQDTVIVAGRLRFPPVVKYAAAEPSACSCGQETLTQSAARDTLTACRLAVAALS